MISTAPKPTATTFKSLLPTDAQGAPHSMMPNIDAPIQDLCDLDLGPLQYPLAPIDMAAEWNTPSVFPSVDHLATRTSTEAREVKVP